MQEMANKRNFLNKPFPNAVASYGYAESYNKGQEHSLGGSEFKKTPSNTLRLRKICLLLINDAQNLRV